MKVLFEAFLDDFRIVPYVRQTKRGKYVKERAKKYNQNQIDLAWLLKVNGRGKVDKFPVILKIRGSIADGRQMAADWDNISKAIQDAMVKARILPDDNLRYVSGADVRLENKAKNEYYVALVA